MVYSAQRLLLGGNLDRVNQYFESLTISTPHSKVPAKYHDRIITDPSMLAKYMQDHYGTKQDRYISKTSNVIKKWQKALNAGRRK